MIFYGSRLPWYKMTLYFNQVEITEIYAIGENPLKTKIFYFNFKKIQYDSLTIHY